MRHLILIASICSLTAHAASAPQSPRSNAIKAFTATTADIASESAPLSCAHPLDPLNGLEINLAVSLVKANPATPKGAFFPNVVLNEPSKAEVMSYQLGKPMPREAIVEAFDRANNALYRAVVDLKAKKIKSFDKLPPQTQPATFFTEFADIVPVVADDAQWKAAMLKRGVKPEDVYLDVWAGGDLEIPVDRNGDAVPAGTRIMRVLSFLRGNQPNPYDRPIEGVVVAVDMNHLKVLQVTDTVIAPVSTYNGKTTDIQREPLSSLQTVQTTPGFQVCGQEISWQGWRFRFALLPREGLVLYNVNHENKGVLRPVAYRIGLSEIYVPYGLPDSNWVWRTAFDVGEYGMGRYANPLSTGADVPSNAKFFGARLADDVGGSVAFPRAVAVYERDGGLLYKRVDPSSVAQDRREARELVITANAWIGNYIYGVNYIFSPSGVLEARVDATGTTLNQGVNSISEGSVHGHVMDTAKSLDGGTALVAAPNHQHFFNFRVDLDVDGPSNRISESNVSGKASELGNAFAADETLLGNESQGRRTANINKARSWKVYSSDSKNSLGMPTGYTVLLGDTAVPYSASDFPARQRAGFVEYPLWATKYQANELYASGEYPNQGKVGEGVIKYSGNENLVDEDLVFWITSGLTHIPDVEQYPVMNTETVTAFKLVPYGYFHSNPALGVR